MNRAALILLTNFYAIVDCESQFSPAQQATAPAQREDASGKRTKLVGKRTDINNERSDVHVKRERELSLAPPSNDDS
jgi:hypothetical protein